MHMYVTVSFVKAVTLCCMLLFYSVLFCVSGAQVCTFKHVRKLCPVEYSVTPVFTRFKDPAERLDLRAGPYGYELLVLGRRSENHQLRLVKDCPSVVIKERCTVDFTRVSSMQRPPHSLLNPHIRVGVSDDYTQASFLLSYPDGRDLSFGPIRLGQTSQAASKFAVEWK